MKENCWKMNSSVFLDTRAPTGLNIELKHYKRELYKGFIDLTA